MKLKTLFQPKKWLATSSKHGNAVGSTDKEYRASHGSSSDTLSNDYSDSTMGNSSKRHSSQKNNKNRKSKTTRPMAIPELVVEYKTPNEKVITAFMNAWNNHTSLEETLSFFASPEVLVKFEDTPSITGGILAAEHDKLYKSFPDIKFTYECIKEDRAGQVVVEELRASATHTGEPYGFGPFPPVPTSNKSVANDPERLWFTVKDGKIVMMQVISLGDITGPPGFYVQIGGTMEMPPPVP
ncbi:unknown protein [Seminavis robusta]|uniref:SnoaL-like domain-containing protein n=1 Tax=Seminavis robusta TaxID=568900 RepID=A0A9N8EZN8_9STRA|nr:unknown protein [Seminavis robusta]|eukprot:Sro2634_g333270.1 n/a (240) ;mRNA; f:6546-7265